MDKRKKPPLTIERILAWADKHHKLYGAWPKTTSGEIVGASFHHYFFLEFPLWASTLIMLPWPVVAFVRGPWRRAKHVADDRCLRCGYDLTGLVERRCPECGTPAAPIGCSTLDSRQL